ncbi:MAG TPA: OmpH family outer membrane protein [Candidatus Acidoferrales bacterium]|nr:OmpH family outer membrane protein [Candidatus Acidoferrales bacterium]
MSANLWPLLQAGKSLQLVHPQNCLRGKELTMSMSMLSKKYTLSLSVGLGLVLSVVALELLAAKPGLQTTPVPAGAKIGIVNIQDAITATDEGKKEFDALQQRFAPKQNSLKSLNDEVEDLKKDFQARSDKLNEDERAKQVKNIEVRQKTLQKNYEDAQNEFQQAEQEVVSRIGGKMLNVLEKYAKNNGYAVILDVSNPQTPVLWASQETNITKQLVDSYNADQSPKRP